MRPRLARRTDPRERWFPGVARAGTLPVMDANSSRPIPDDKVKPVRVVIAGRETTMLPITPSQAIALQSLLGEGSDLNPAEQLELLTDMVKSRFTDPADGAWLMRQMAIGAYDMDALGATLRELAGAKRPAAKKAAKKAPARRAR